MVFFPDLVKISLQEFQHMFPQLTTRIPTSINNNASPRGSQTTLNYTDHDLSSVKFVPMECPILPLDTDFKCKDMIRASFNTESGPLWRVQVIDPSDLDDVNLRFGPELAAILEDDSADLEVKWQHFLRYNSGCVNQVSKQFFSSRWLTHLTHRLMTIRWRNLDLKSWF